MRRSIRRYLSAWSIMRVGWTTHLFGMIASYRRRVDVFIGTLRRHSASDVLTGRPISSTVLLCPGASNPPLHGWEINPPHLTLHLVCAEHEGTILLSGVKASLTLGGRPPPSLLPYFPPLPSSPLPSPPHLIPSPSLPTSPLRSRTP